MKRIAEQTGHPLSQASSAGWWLSRRLLQSSVPSIQEHIKSRYAELPAVVVERLREQDQGEEFFRELVSLNTIASFSEFWTIESRTIDYLGTISRDLGKELTVGQFLGALAPELQNPKVNPVVPDAWTFIGDLLQSHTIVSAEYSKQHQRTILEWRQLNQPRIRFDDSLSDKLIKNTSIIFEPNILVRIQGYLPNPNLMLDQINRVMVAPINGDIKDIVGIQTRLAIILAQDSDIGFAYQELNRVLKEVSSSDESVQNHALFLCLFWMLSITVPGNTYTRHERIDPSIIRDIWRENYERANALLIKYQSNLVLPIKIDELFGTQKNWFDASSYWRNWFNDRE